MKKVYSFMLFLALAIVLTAPSVSYADIAQNKGFEIRDGGTGAANWFAWHDPASGVSQQRVTDIFRSGTACANTKLTNTNGNTIGGWGQVLTGWYPGQVLTGSVWVKVSMAGNAYAQLKFEIIKPSGNQDIWGPSTTSNNWTKIEQTFAIPSDTTEIKMLAVHVASSGANNGDIWFDDAAVVSNFYKASLSEEEAWRLNCGGAPDYIDASGNLWMKDESYLSLNRWGFTNGTAVSAAQNISGTDLDPVFQTYCQGKTDMSYKIEVPNGVYQVKLMFAETYWQRSRRRVFDVAVEGVRVLTDYDIYAAKGFAAADERIFRTTVNDGRLDITFPRVSRDKALICGIEVKPVDVPDEAFLDFIQKKKFWYFWNEADPATGLVKDKEDDWQSGSEYVSSIAVDGLALSVYTIGASRGWVSDSDAYSKTMKILNSFDTLLTNVHGFWYHMVNMASGARDWYSELSTVDSAIFIMGALQSGEYFRDTHPDVTAKADALYRRMEWTWFMDVGDTWQQRFLNMAWAPEGDGSFYSIPSGKPEGGFYCLAWWENYCESVFVDLLALASPTYYINNAAWTDMKRNWVDAFGYRFMHLPSLFIHQYHHLYFDLMNKHDGFADYFENSKKATLANRQTCIEDTLGRYSEKNWGLTACYGLNDNYNVYGADPGGYYDGTSAPTAPVTSVTFTPDESIQTARNMFFQYKHNIWGRYGFCDSFNVEQGFRSKFALGLNSGPMIIGIENYRTGMVRNTFMRNPYMQAALGEAGFKSFSQGPLITESSRGVDQRGMMAFDGNMATRWSSDASDPQWLKVDFGSAKDISAVTINWEAAYGKSYLIQFSSDDKNWQDVYSTTTGDGGEDIVTFSPVTARYLRLYGTERGTSWGYSIWEMRITYTDSAIGAVASSMESPDTAAYKVVDNNLSTRWSSEFSDSQWIYIDFKTEKTFSTVTLNWETAYGKAYKIQVSDDAVNWRDIYSTASGDGGIDTINVGTQVSRYLRMYGTQRGTEWGYSLWEFGAN
jgi:hypothetical protein